MKAALILYTHTKAKDGLCAINVRVSGMRTNEKGKRVPVTRYAPFPIRVKEAQWDPKRRRVRDTHPNAKAVNLKLADLERRVEDLFLSGRYSDPDAFRSALAVPAPRQGESFYVLARARIKVMRETKKIAARTEKTRISILRTIEKLRPAMRLHDVTKEYLEGLQADLYRQGLAKNTVNGKLRKLRTMWQDLAGDEVRSPWKGWELRDEGSDHVHLTIDEVKAFSTVDLSGHKPFLEVARNSIMLSYYLGARRFTDLALFEPAQIEGRYLKHTVHKSTRKVIKRLYLTDEALRIIGLYRNGPYLLPLITVKVKNEDERLRLVDSANGKVNIALKVIAALAGIEKNVTTRTMRHTVANWIKQKGYSTALASELLDHEDQATTETYMDSFPTEAVKGILTELSEAV